jgi:SAM-dependent methyltransferase
MTEPAKLVRQHYDPDEGSEAWRAKIAAIVAGLDGPVTSAALAGLDQFHAGGLAATGKLAELAGIGNELEILDAGSGLGGPSRYLAQTWAARIVGVDLSPGFVKVATMLAERGGSRGLVTYQTGDLLSLAFPDARFDLVWTQHVAMNIRDRARLYRAFRRVLKPSEKLAFHDVIAADDQPTPHFPVPWARTEATSFLMTKADTLAALHEAGFALEVFNDVTEETLSWFSQQRAAAPADLSLASIMGPGFGETTANLARNLREGRLGIAMGVFAASPKA